MKKNEAKKIDYSDILALKEKVDRKGAVAYNILLAKDQTLDKIIGQEDDEIFQAENRRADSYFSTQVIPTTVLPAEVPSVVPLDFSKVIKNTGIMRFKYAALADDPELKNVFAFDPKKEVLPSVRLEDESKRTRLDGIASRIVEKMFSLCAPQVEWVNASGEQWEDHDHFLGEIGLDLKVRVVEPNSRNSTGVIVDSPEAAKAIVGFVMQYELSQLGDEFVAKRVGSLNGLDAVKAINSKDKRLAVYLRQCNGWKIRQPAMCNDSEMINKLAPQTFASLAVSQSPAITSISVQKRKTSEWLNDNAVIHHFIKANYYRIQINGFPHHHVNNDPSKPLKDPNGNDGFVSVSRDKGKNKGTPRFQLPEFVTEKHNCDKLNVRLSDVLRDYKEKIIIHP